MRQSQSFSWSKTVMVFSTAALIFLLGILTSNGLNSMRLKNLDSNFEELRIDAATLEVEYALFSENPCDLNPTVLSDQLHQTGSRLNFMEAQLGVNDPKVLMLKELYSLMEIRHWLLLEKENKECSRNNVGVLFFYADEKTCDDCEQQGYVLDAIRRTNDNVSVYSFDVGLDNPALVALKARFNITQVPSIASGGIILQGFSDKNKVENVIFS